MSHIPGGNDLASADGLPLVGDSSQGPSRKRVAVIGGVASGVGTFITSNDWCCAAFSAALMGVLIAAVLDLVLWPLALRNVPFAARIRVVAALSVAVGVSLFYRVDDGDLFELSLGMRPPDGVQIISASRHYGGGPGDVVVLIHLTATPETVEQILLARPFVPEEIYDDTPGDIFRSCFNGYVIYGGRAWEPPKELTIPHAYRWDGEEGPEITNVLWDSATGRVWVLYTFG